jgi:ferredoxin
MTPFGLRKKLKSILGGAPRPPAPELPRYPVVFLLPKGGEYTVDAKEGDSLVLASGRSAEPIATGCADGTCATCRVEVLEGVESLSPEEGHEKRTKQENNVDSSMRMGCQVAVLGPGVKVRIVNVLGEELVE